MFIHCMQDAKEICKCQQTPSPREEKLIRDADFAKQLCENSCSQKAYLENANCINSLQPEATDCFSEGMKYAEKMGSSSEAFCLLQKSYADCLVEITSKKCGLIAADIQKKLFSFEMGVFFSCHDFEERSKNTKIHPSCGTSSYKHESKELVKLITNLMHATLENTESLSISVSRSSVPTVLSQRPKEVKSAEKGGFSKRVDTSTLSSENTPVPEFSTTTEVSSNKDSLSTEVDESAIDPEYSTKSNELSIINAVKRYINDVVFITDSLISFVSSSNVIHRETSLESEYSIANEAVSNTEEIFSDKHLDVDWTTDIEDTESVIVSVTPTDAEESSSAKLTSDSSFSESDNEIGSEEQINTSEMYKRKGDDKFHVSPKTVYTRTNTTSFALYKVWNKKRVYMGCGIASISWVKDSPLHRIYCGFTAIESDLGNPFKCDIETDITCQLTNKISRDKSKITCIDDITKSGLKLVAYRKPKHEKYFRVRASMIICYFMPNLAYHLEIENPSEKQQEEVEKFRPIIIEPVESRRKRSATLNERLISHRSGLLLKHCTDLEDKQHRGRLPVGSLLDYVLIGEPYYPHCKKESNDETENKFYHVRASVKIRAAIKIDPDTF
ncbi:hypothetical protein TNIN_171751 [Trichonephila inaurata madagascariensis]|uniref:Uncharacterized protein n=1 Tax=Trichonephila inaurata madagascariensis TaxID=2747483 RepID=A0A8X6XKV4_9ARAC|nr:hypothetical protein TNIN_171751 [Trichonephila inaurata madagascariensis]